jgi:hypothetical protein
MATGEVVGVAVYRKDAVVVREGQPLPLQEITRGTVQEFTYESRRRLAFVANNSPIEFVSMITLTYPKEYSNDGQAVKSDLNAFLVWLRRFVPGVHYLWFLEFQRRGAPHYHLLLDYYPRSAAAVSGFRVRVASAWWRAVGSFSGLHWLAGTRTERLRSKEGGRHYAVKYAMKMKQKCVPDTYQNVGRFWGCSADVQPEPIETRRATEDDIRADLEDWEYYRGEQQPLHRVLYNQGSRFRSNKPTADNTSA